MFSLDSAREVWETTLAEADSLYRRNAVDSALVMGHQALERVEADSGYQALAVAMVLDRLATYCKTAHRYEDAVSHRLRALEIRETALGPDHLDVAHSLDELARLYHHLGAYADAEPLHLRSLEIKEKDKAARPQDAADTVSDLAIACLYQGKHGEAEALFERALAMREGLLGPDHSTVIQAAHNLGSCFYEQGKYRRAEELLLEAVGRMERALPADDPLQAKCRNNLANTYRDQGRYSEAYPLYVEALRIHEKNNTARSREVAEVRLNMGILNYYLGLYSEAAQDFRGALDTAEDLFGPENLLVGRLTNNLAMIYAEQGEYAEAGRLWEQALAVKRKVLPPDHPETATTILNLAIMQKTKGDYARSAGLHAEALAMRQRTLPPRHPDIAQSLQHIAQLYLDQRDLVAADSLLDAALRIQEHSVGTDHPDAIDTRLLMCESRLLAGETGEAFALASYAASKAQRIFTDNVAVLTDDQILKNSKYFRLSLDLLITSLVESQEPDDSMRHRSVDAVMECKGRASDEICTRWRSILDDSDSTTLALYDRLILTRSALSDLLFERPGAADAGLTKTRIDSLRVLVGGYETALTERSAVFRRLQDSRLVSTERIVSLLPADAILIEYLRYDRLDPRSGLAAPWYSAVVLDRRQPPTVLDLGPASSIDSLVAAYRAHMVAVSQADHMPVPEDMQAYRRIARAVYDGVVAPLEGRIRNSDRLFIAADGGLNLVSFAGLIDAEGRFLIEGHAVHYLTAARGLIRIQSEETPGAGLLAVGDPDFDGTGSETFLLAGTDSPPRTAWNLRSFFDDPSALKATRLERTGVEVLNVAKLWESQSNEPVDILTWSDATEEKVTSLAPGKRCVHLATHGFYLPESGHSHAARPERLLPEPVSINPLLASGLLLAGSNRDPGSEDAPGTEDGFLTAYEIAGIDLRGVELVVLSACESGLGGIVEGEGVYGLRRAFEMAGARTIVSSLWPVPDAPAADMMSMLYEVSGESISDRLRGAQLDQIARLRQQGRTGHPYIWAAFIAIGDWK